MARARDWARTNPLALITAAFAVTVLAGAAFIGTAHATDDPAFCRAACHEMQPYADAWAVGPHADVACVECHVDPGTIDRLKHKVTALSEVRTHVFGDVAFPLDAVAPIPDERCRRCHEKITVSTPGFDHARHAAEGPCQQCHGTAGHAVSVAALEEAGVLASTASSRTAAPASVTLASNTSTTTLESAGEPAPSSSGAPHIAVDCARCHDLERTACVTCHEPQHEETGSVAKTGACETCHAPGPEFTFTHPQDLACATCHSVPEKHRGGTCTKCHTSTKEWDFDHPGSKAECTDCHAKPAGHSGKACTTCHKSGDTWKFSHPASKTCSTCHSAPANHDRGSGCSTCHSPSRAWSSATRKHPGASAKCTSCHDRPSKHASGTCSSCHATGRSWSFRHTSSTKCGSCHSAPAKHFGSSCKSCHSPKRSWGKATFSHPRIRGGEHTYRSFSCAKCHPSGYSSASCTKCHSDNDGGDKEDDDDEDEDDD